MTGIWSRMAQGRWTGEPGTNDIDSGAPYYDVYRTADGEYMAVGSIEPKFWAQVLEVLEIDPDTLPDQQDRARWPEVKQVVAAAFARRTRAEWTRRFAGRDACVTPVLGLAEAPGDAHLAARGTLTPSRHGPEPAAAPRLSRTPVRAREADDLDAVLDRWGVHSPVAAG
jgi:alpha-methylacyl-CoA racemase